MGRDGSPEEVPNVSDEADRLTRTGGATGVPGIVHLGVGAFARAHLFLYTDDAMREAGGDWWIRGVSLRRPDQRDRLAPQGFAYTAVAMGPSGPEPRTVEVMSDLLVAPESTEAVIAGMADPAVAIVSLTVTEKGYCHRPSTGRLDLDHKEVRHDIANPGAPVSAPGFIVAALARRRERGAPPFTVLSCDNLPDNGQVAQSVVTRLAREIDPGLAAWIEREGAFPGTMVDRIVPATTDDDIAALTERTGRLDRSPVFHEPFSQWVIEDRFVGGHRPAWERVGAQLVEAVRPFELTKLRCLNGTHSALAYLGYLAGHETIAETVADEAFDSFLDRIWALEIVPSITPPQGTDLAAYTASLKERYRNSAIRHRTWQIAMDGSQKLPQRLLGTVADNIDAGRPIGGLALAVAAWMRYASGVDEGGDPIDVRDPLAERFAKIGERAGGPSERVDAFLAVSEVFPRSLAGDERFRQPLTEAATRLETLGARAAVAEYAS